MKNVKSKKLLVKIRPVDFFGLSNSNSSAYLKFPLRFSTLAVCLFALAFVLSSPTFAQKETRIIPKDVVPPPLHIISKEENKLLDSETKMKNRTKLSIEMMDARLTNSEQLLEKEDYQESLNQIGRFQALLKDALKFLKRNQHEKGSLKNFKKIELSLRDVMTRLEIMRREMPFKYGYHIKDIMFFVRESRTKALNPLFDDTVLPEVNN